VLLLVIVVSVVMLVFCREGDPFPFYQVWLGGVALY